MQTNLGCVSCHREKHVTRWCSVDCSRGGGMGCCCVWLTKELLERSWRATVSTGTLSQGRHQSRYHRKRTVGVGRDLWRSSPTLSGKRIRISVKPQHRLNKGRACPPDYRGQNCSVAHKVLQNGATAAWFEWLTLWFPR